jgi:NADPH:quinone reductase-like Zn-dependent oxidoreductase
MKAMLIRRYGGPEVFEAGEAPTPRPGRGEVLVRVRGSSVNPVDCGIRAGMLKSFIRLRLPAVSLASMWPARWSSSVRA